MIADFIKWILGRFSPADFNKATLKDHFVATYFWLRLVMGVLGILVPVVLWSIHGFGKPNFSISGYYHSDTALSRNFLVGSLTTIGVCLIMYRGYTYGENVLLNIAGFGIIGVAFLPCGEIESPRYLSTSKKDRAEIRKGELETLEIDPDNPSDYLELTSDTLRLKDRNIHAAYLSYTISTGAVKMTMNYNLHSKHDLHLPCAVVFFVAIWGSMFLYSQVTTQLQLGPKGEWYRKFYAIYQWSFLVIVGTLTVAAYAMGRPYHIFVAEWLGVWGFGGYWLIKTAELKDGAVDLEHFAQVSGRRSGSGEAS